MKELAAPLELQTNNASKEGKRVMTSARKLAAGIALFCLSATGVTDKAAAQESTTSIPETTTTTTTPANGLTYTGPEDGYKVAFVGDSMMGLAAPYIRDMANGKYRVNFQYANGMRIDQLQPFVENVVNDPNGPPDAIILNAGTNDMMQNNTDWQPAFEQQRTAIHSANIACYGLTTVATRTAEMYSRMPEVVNGINQAYRNEAEVYANVGIASDWDQLTIDNIDYMALDEQTFGDGIHAGPTGRERTAQDYMDFLLNDCGLEPVTPSPK